MRRFATLAAGDWKNVARDSFLVMMLAVPLILTLVIRWGVPFLADKLRSVVDLVPHYPFILSLMLFFPGMLFGAVIGFLLLDERDEGVLDYMAVTPLGKNGYFRFRLFFPTLLAAVAGVVLFPLAAPVPYPFWKTVPLLLVGALTAPLVALFLATFARNKVEGMALYKLTGLYMAGPALAWFVPADWGFLGGIFPSYWVARAFYAATGGGAAYWPGLAAAFVASLLWLWLLLRFRRQMRA
jgi:fluoroquinolone transport system permease protein